MSDFRTERAASVFGGPEPVRPGPFGPVALDARLTFVWATPLVQAAAFISVSIAAALVWIVAAPALGIAHTSDDGALLLVIVALVVQFPLWAALAVVWVRSFERRSLESAGLGGPRRLQRYLIGLAAGVGIALLLGLLSPLVAPAAEIDVEALDASRLLSPAWLLTLGGVGGLLLMQSACEELAFRGWMLSAIVARRGIAVGLAVVAPTFGIAHADLFASGLLPGAVGVVALSCVGLFLCLWALVERSILGPCGVHGAFNATLVVLGVVGAAATNPEIGPAEALRRTFLDAMSVQGSEGLAGATLQLAVFGALSVIPAALLVTRLRRRA